MRDFETAKRYGDYANLSKEIFDGSHFVDRSQPEVRVDSDSLQAIIFAPDPITNVPRSDLAVVMSRDSAPEVAQYIRDNLMRPVSDSPVVDDPDFALKAVKDRRESTEAYIARVRDFALKTSSKDM